MKKSPREWWSIKLARNPGAVVLGIILLFNLVFILASAAVISAMSLTGTEHMNFLEAAYYTLTMILDAGCIDNVVGELGNAKIAICIVCLIVVIIGMITFTGATIGYITNYISNFIDKANDGVHPLHLNDHIVIINWNSRASEIVNDLLYCGDKQKVVVLVHSGKEEIRKEIDERIAYTVSRTNEELREEAKGKSFFAKLAFMRANKLKANRLVVIVREGDVFSSKQLRDVSLDRAKSVIILGDDESDAVCKYMYKETVEELTRGNARTVKTLMQVSDITAAESSRDNQRIIVEITDDWTGDLVDKIIKWKARAGKCNIVPIKVNKILGQILSQFSLMPELNLAYRELFSNRNATFFSVRSDVENDEEYNAEYLKTHRHAIPLTTMVSGGQRYYYYSADSEADIEKHTAPIETQFKVKLNYDYWIDKKHVIVLGHNSKSKDIMDGFACFRAEWNRHDGDEIVEIVVLDDKKHLEQFNYYKEYPFVVETVTADIYDAETVCSAIKKFIASHDGDTSVLILSDDACVNNIDANPLTNIVYLQDILREKLVKDPDFDVGKIDVIVEILNPKHFDVLKGYSANNVVISNRYISKMILQIGEKDALFDFYSDILVYDTGETDSFESKEIYAKKVKTFFEVVPEECTAEELIRAVYTASCDRSVPPEKRNPTIVLGYVKPNGDMILFNGDQRNEKVKLSAEDKLIVFTNH
ncbi:MAG: hypothetical protein ACI4VK_04705 [Candidatus Coproplasma sp.]